MNVECLNANHPLPDGELTLLGAVSAVTGAMTRVEIGGQRVLVDAGMAQGAEARNWSVPSDAHVADTIVLTHAHNDHVGSLPTLIERGFSGEVIATDATLRIVRIVLEDGLRLRGASEAEREAFFRHLESVQRPVRYGEDVRLKSGLQLRFHDAGHILGSASVAIASEKSRVLISGDLGRPGTPILRDPNSTWSEPFDLALMESTYGDREQHQDPGAIAQSLLRILRRALERGGHVLVPAFAIGRTQTLLWHLNALVEDGHLPPFPVAVDTPMGLRVTEAYERFSRYYDQDAMARIGRGDDPFEFETLYAVWSGRDSARLRTMPGPLLLIAGSGMCTGGRIVQHLADGLDDPSNTVLFVGYQAKGTLGRAIQQAAADHSVATVDGRRVAVRAAIETLSGLSAHADRSELLDWIGAVPTKRVALHHGEPAAQRALAQAIAEQRSR